MSVNIDAWINEISLDTRSKNALRKIFDQIYTDAAANKTAFDNHTHRCNGGQSATYNSSTPQSDTGTLSASTAETFDNNLDT